MVISQIMHGSSDLWILQLHKPKCPLLCKLISPIVMEKSCNGSAKAIQCPPVSFSPNGLQVSPQKCWQALFIWGLPPTLTALGFVQEIPEPLFAEDHAQLVRGFRSHRQCARQVFPLALRLSSRPFLTRGYHYHYLSDWEIGFSKWVCYLSFSSLPLQR